MNLNEIVKAQREFDERHGWTPPVVTEKEISQLLTRDLIGLFGEMGEFANAVKKLQLAPSDELCKVFQDHSPELREELVDFMIYVVRIASYLGVDLEEEYEKKRKINERRFIKFLKNEELDNTDESAQ